MTANAKTMPIGLQLFSVRHECQKDEGKNFPAVVEAVAKMGYQGVEFAGYYGYSAAELKRIIDDHGLPCCGAHVGLDTLLGDELKRSIDFHQTLGNKYLVVPGLKEEYRNSIDAWKRTAELFNGIAERLKPLGMYTGYHNHAVEFQPMEGQVPWDVLFGATVPEVIMQLDIGNAIHGGGNCEATLATYPGRSLTVHVKEYGGSDEAVIGEGEVDWPTMLPAMAETGGAEWFIVEHERDPNRALADVDKCLQYLRGVQESL